MSDGEVDDFAQSILRRAKLRNAILNPDSSAPSMASGLDAIRKRTVPQESLEPVKHLPVLSDESAHTRKLKTDEKIIVDDPPQVEEEVELDEEDEAESSSEEENKIPNSAPMSIGSRRPFRRLGELYGEEGSMPSPVRDHTIGEKTPDPTPQHLMSDKSGARRGRLHALASTINGWEDDLTHYCSPTSRFNVSPPKQSRKSNGALGGSLGGRTPPFKPNFTPEPACGREAQGFVSNISKTKLTFEYEYSDVTDTKGSPERARSVSPVKHMSLFEKHMTGVSSSPIEKRSASTSPVRKPSGSPVRNMPISSTPISKASSPVRSPPKACTSSAITETQTPKAKLSVAQKTAMFEVKGPLSNASFVGKQKDPAEMTVAERARFFEQQAAQSGISSGASASASRNPGVISRVFGKPFGRPNNATPLSPKKSTATQITLPKGTVENQRRLFENPCSRPQESPEEEEEVQTKQFACPQPRQLDIAPVVETPPPMFVPPAPPKAVPAPPPLPINLSVTFSALASQIESPPEVSRSRSPQKQTSTTPKRGASPSPPRFGSPKSKYPGLRDVKRIRVKEPKPGRIYPSLTDIESTETETESEMNEEEQFDMDYEDEDDLESHTSHVSGFSLGTHIERLAKQNAPPARRNPHYRPSEDFSTSLACRQIDELIDDALEGQSFSMDTIMEADFHAPASSTPNACSTGLDFYGRKDVPQESWQVSDELTRLSSFDKAEEQNNINEFSSSPSQSTIVEADSVNEEYDGPETNIDAILETSGEIQEIKDTDASEVCSSFEYTNTSIIPNKDGSPVGTSSPLYAKRREPSPATTPLVHTVSFFRKQQGQAINTTPRKAAQDCAPVRIMSPTKKESDDTESTNLIIKKLKEEMAGQERSIAQVSKALSLCKSTVEFSESTENVECERILLIASQKRMLIWNEIQRLKTEGVLSQPSSVLSPTKQELGPSCRGNMSLSDVEVQLKREFVSKAMAGNTVYHFICLAKYRTQLEASSLISIGNGVSSSKVQGGVLHFSNAFTLSSLEPEFEVKLEVYVLETMKEFLPHEAKYHIKKESRKLTPKKLKHESKLSRPFQQSPAGPNAVLTSNFNLCGSLKIDISTLERNHWELEGTRVSGPLEGSVAIRIQCSAEGGVEERGFLTMFDDVSGFGAWHRRWCKLTKSDLCFWMYPEDEMENKVPMGSIPLRLCVTSRVGPVTREVCARANTFLLVTTRVPQEKDQDTLTTSCHAGYTAIRHLLTADTKEERDMWCKQINKALTNLRAWDPHAHSPDDSLFYK